MLVRFWGTRGSLPVAAKADAIRTKIAKALVAANGHSIANLQQADDFIDRELDFAAGATYGGATACVEIESGDSFFICDMGSGLREFGLSTIKRCADGHARIYNFFQSHLHWDHIMGFPFFVPSFDPAAVIRIHSAHPDAEDALRRQQEEISFPVPFDWLRASIEFVTMTPGEPIEVDGLKVVAEKQQHSHDSYGYRFTDGSGRTIVFSTDSEHKVDDMKDEAAFIEFFRDADLVICDTMYSLADSVSMKEDWGHSSNIVAIDLCHEAGARRLALFHHEPTYDDEAIQRMHQESIRYEELTREGSALEVLCAYDGLEIRL
ncbi:MBL fold metallo-hydrolase [Sphingomonas sp. RB56-2]|uniref:MBL fold metallo-hydrolase n=1 Tax=Sphingomonas brevis TaxID=2908206 RepID=A0ABT0S970_9SPHN|nr:MBL fold metallo-hydrolase [Sphingomonas brevis]MCL6740956.1 MBL fold metallo-hydrolase [Sphingomonas brevis]